jgi:hypothetical protein
MSNEYRLAIENGKYTFVKPANDYRVHVLRHGEPWVVIEQGCNAVFSLLYDAISDRGLVEAVLRWAGRRSDDGDDLPHRIGPAAGQHGKLHEAVARYCEERGIGAPFVASVVDAAIAGPSASDGEQRQQQRLIDASERLAAATFLRCRADALEAMHGRDAATPLRLAADDIEAGVHMGCPGKTCDDDDCDQHNSCRGCGNELPRGRATCGGLECGGGTLP